jgi:hypothetical protein
MANAYAYTLTFGVLSCFFVIAHDWRRLLQCNVTRNPNKVWLTLLHQRRRPNHPSPSVWQIRSCLMLSS